MPLTPAQIYAYARQAGFPPVVATTVTAVALRESGGDPAAHNGNASTGDNSFGLLQINLAVKGIADLLTNNGIHSEDLFDPKANMLAGFILWNHRNANLDVLWYITRSGGAVDYRARYEKHLPEAQSAALAYEEAARK